MRESRARYAVRVFGCAVERKRMKGRKREEGKGGEERDELGREQKSGKLARWLVNELRACC